MANVRKLILTHGIKFDNREGKITLLERHPCPLGIIAILHKGSVYYIHKSHIVLMELPTPVNHVD